VPLNQEIWATNLRTFPKAPKS